MTVLDLIAAVQLGLLVLMSFLLVLGIAMTITGMAQERRREPRRPRLCPTCDTLLLRDGTCPSARIARNESVNPARYSYGALVDRPAVDAHLRAWGVI